MMYLYYFGDKFAHCPSESDEMACDLSKIVFMSAVIFEFSFKNMFFKVIENYAEVSRDTVMIIVSIIATAFILTTVVTLVLTFFDNCKLNLPQSLMNTLFGKICFLRLFELWTSKIIYIIQLKAMQLRLSR